PSNKSFKVKRILGKKIKQNRPIPHWIRLRTDNTIRYNAKRRNWRRTKLKLMDELPEELSERWILGFLANTRIERFAGITNHE
ncbi:60S ribosomal protein L39, partial [Phlyctochytrium planicorne]